MFPQAEQDPKVKKPKTKNLVLLWNKIMLIITITIITIRRKKEGKKRTIIIVSISSEFHSGLVPHFSAPRLKNFPWKKFLIFFLKTTALKSVL